jgi:RHS repeat-associated protein
MLDLLEAGTESDNWGISSESMGPYFEASAPCMEVSESTFCLQLHFDYQASGPLVQNDIPAKPVLEIVQSFNVVFSLDSSTYRFTGKPVSQTTGLYYYFHRWSDPSTGRFISPDPKQGSLENPQTLNLYVYVADSPLNNDDPSGEFINIVIGAIAGGLIGWAACGLTTGAWFSTGCGEAALVGAGTGALAGATFGLSLGVMGVAEGATATIGPTLVAGFISGTISGIANFDLNSLFGLEKPSWDNFVKDTTIGAVSGVLGGALGRVLGGVKGESLDPRNLGRELQESGQAFVNVVSPKVQEVAKFLGDSSAPSISFSSGTAKVVIGTGVELGKALLTGVIDPGLQRIAQFFSW